MDLYFVSTNDVVEINCIKKVKPKGLMLSYWYWKKKNIKELINKIGYKPNIIVDSGAYTAWNQNKNVNINDYYRFLDENKDYINEYISLDIIGNPQKTYENYLKFITDGYKPMPVYHYNSDIDLLKKYLKITDRVCLGNTVPVKNKKIVANWVNSLIQKFPQVDFHLLGSTSKIIIKNCPRLKSCDSSTYIIGAVMGRPKHIETKLDRAVYNMKKIITYERECKTQEQLNLF